MWSPLQHSTCPQCGANLTPETEEASSGCFELLAFVLLFPAFPLLMLLLLAFSGYDSNRRIRFRCYNCGYVVESESKSTSWAFGFFLILALCFALILAALFFYSTF